MLKKIEKMYRMERWISTEKENLQKIPGWHSKLQNRISEIKDSLDRSNRMDIGKKDWWNWLQVNKNHLNWCTKRKKYVF